MTVDFFCEQESVRFTSKRREVDMTTGGLCEKNKSWGAPDSSFRAFSLHPLQKSKNQKLRKSKNGTSEMISVTRHNPGTNHRNRK